MISNYINNLKIMPSQKISREIPRVPANIDFPEVEETIQKFWKDIEAFEKSLKLSEKNPRFTFYDGPPFATGLPHYGHILAGTIKDVVTRYAHQKEFHVKRRFGWDTHGLPVEFEIDKKLGIRSQDDVMKMGITQYNAECRKIVMRYSEEWEKVMGRLGRWIDFKNDYKTLYPWYMESVWWVFKQLYLKGLVYKGNKVMPYSTGCVTPLSNFESGQNYKDIVDPTITVSFPLLNDSDNAELLIWTTTPWTLPSNLAVCVNPALEYVRFKHVSSGHIYIMLERRISSVFKEDKIEILEKIPGKEMEGWIYEPVFSYFQYLSEKGAFRVLSDDYVTPDAGTGIVHLAPYFGEDDYRICLNQGIISKDMEPVCPVDETGKFTEPMSDFKRQYFKDADRNITAFLKVRKRVVHQSQIKHSYPFCWRSDTPLIYRAVPSWFIRVEQMQGQLLNNTAKTHWVPNSIKEKRFGNWLKEARDWSISRNRYWGTPIPIWMSSDGDEMICIGSIEELEQLSGKEVTDLHRDSIDGIEIPSSIPGGSPLKRIPEVFDCWFESGCMPYAQHHYPFENTKTFEESFPADFIAEGIDQTRGWFYTLTVISTALFDTAPYKNLIVNGLILAEDGHKMSKRKKNYPDPMKIINQYGADALRLYLVGSPAVRAENLSFKEAGVRDMVKDILLPWYNAFRFLMQRIEEFNETNQLSFIYDPKNLKGTNNIMDNWILSCCHSLLIFIENEMKLYHVYSIIPKITKFFEYLTNWYIRMNRKRLKNESLEDDCHSALTTLFDILYNLTIIMAPYAPFMAEHIYQTMKTVTRSCAESIHFLPYPSPNHSFINIMIERVVFRMHNVIELGRTVRNKRNLPLKYPSAELIVIHHDPQYLEDIQSVKGYISNELNVRKINLTTDKNQYGIKYRAEPNYKVLGLRLKHNLRNIAPKIQELDDHQLSNMISQGKIEISGHYIEADEIRIILASKDLNIEKYEILGDGDCMIIMDLALESSMEDEGIAREIINYIQKLRKKAHLVPADKICVWYNTEGDLNRIAEQYKDYIEAAIKTHFEYSKQKQSLKELIIDEHKDVKGGSLYIAITRNEMY